VALFHAVYTGRPRRGHNLITYGNHVYDPAEAQVLASASRRITFAAGLQLTVRELRLVGADGPRLVWYWYCVDARCSASPTRVKLRQAWDVLRRRSSRSSVWAMSLSIRNGDLVQAREHLGAFARALPSPRLRDASADGDGPGGAP
jgi:EpsI family protein